jgi:hypothetical protein
MPRSPISAAALLTLLLLTLQFGCAEDKAAPPTFIEPAGSTVDTFSFDVVIDLGGDVDKLLGPELFLNGAQLPLSGGPKRFTATVSAGQRLRDRNTLRVDVTRVSDLEVISAFKTFDYLPPKARLSRITSTDQLITGPLAHGRVGDFLLENAEARFIIQDVGQRDLYSVGAFGGNIIDAELVGRPGLDNFLEVQTMLNLETVLNAQEATIVNDGQDGTAAILSVCGPDDLLDFVNASSQVIDAGLPFPAGVDDNDQEVWACTDYSLEPGEAFVKMDTEIFNNQASGDLALIVGDWMNAGGELDVYARPGAGSGAPLTSVLGALAFAGTGEAAGVDYGYVTTPDVGATNQVNISGVTVILHHASPLALLGAPSPFVVPAGGSLHTVRYLGVGDGSSSNAVDMENQIKGVAAGTLSGQVRVGGVGVADARVSVGVYDATTGTIGQLVTSFVTDDQGNYSGSIAIPTAGTVYGAAAAKKGALYEGGGPTPTVTQLTFTMPGEAQTLDFDLPANATVQVNVVDERPGSPNPPMPARVTVVGLDPSPEEIRSGGSLPGFGSAALGLFYDVGDAHPFGVVAIAYADASGSVSFEIEPGDYQLFVSRGPEYSLFEQPISPSAAAPTVVDATLMRLVSSPGFVSSDFHVHGINSADSRVSHRRRVVGYAAEGIDNIVMTDHHVHTDLTPIIQAEGLETYVTSTVGEEITTFDYGHFNAYPLQVDDTRVSKGSTDWAVAAPPGEDFPMPLVGVPSYNATPAEIAALATAGANSLIDTTIQVNHIDSHFAPMRIDTALSPISDALDTTARLNRRLDPAPGNLFHPFPALEVLNGSSIGAQNEFFGDRIGIWMNLLNQGYPTTAIADTDTHSFDTLNSAGGVTWTAAPLDADDPATLDVSQVARSVSEGRAVAGMGIFVRTRLLSQDRMTPFAEHSLSRDTHMQASGGNVSLVIDVQAPAWAQYDTIEIYANAATTPSPNNGPAGNFLYGATPTLVLTAGATDTGSEFIVGTTELNPTVPGTEIQNSSRLVDFDGLTQDTWFVVVVRGTPGVSEPMFPVYPKSLDAGSNTSLADLLDGNLGEGGVMALGFTNALYYDHVAP